MRINLIVKALLIISLSTIYITNVYSQCNQPVPPAQFTGALNQIKTKTNDRDKIRTAINFVANNCISCQQLIEVSKLFPDDKKKFLIARRSYANIVNYDAFFEVYDIFTKMSYAIRLYDFTKNFENGVVDKDFNYEDEPVKRNDYSGIDFPNPYGYKGPIGINCKYPVSDNDFIFILKNIQPAHEDNMLYTLKDIVKRNCLSVAQIMKLAFQLQTDKNRLDFLIFSYERSFDLNNYYKSHQLFNSQYYKDELFSFINDFNSQSNNLPNINCIVTQQEMNEVLKNIKDESFTQEKVKKAKYLISIKCFSIEQYRTILGIFFMDDEKISIMKYAYDFSLEPDRMYTLKDMLSFPSYKQDYDNFLYQKANK